MNILYVTHNYAPQINGGAVRCTANAEEWARCGHEVTVLTRKTARPARTDLARPRIKGVAVYVPRRLTRMSRALEYGSFLLTATIAALSLRKADIVVVSSPHLLAGLVGLVASRRMRAPMVFEVRDLWPDSIVALKALPPSLGLGLLYRLEALMYRKAALIVLVTQQALERVAAKGVPRARLRMIPNGADLTRFGPGTAPELRQSLGFDGQFVVSYFGTLGIAQMPDFILKAAAILMRQAPDVRIVIGGGGAMRGPLAQAAQRRGLANIVLLDQVPHEEMATLWHLSDAAFSILREVELFNGVIPSKAYEAFATGTPLITNIQGELPAMLHEKGRAPALFIRTAEDFAQSVIRLRDDPALRARMAADGLALACDFDRAALAREMLREIHGLWPLPEKET